MSFNAAYFSLMVCLDLCPCKRQSVSALMSVVPTLIHQECVQLGDVYTRDQCSYTYGIYILDRRNSWIKKGSNGVSEKREILIARQRLGCSLYSKVGLTVEVQGRSMTFIVRKCPKQSF